MKYTSKVLPEALVVVLLLASLCFPFDAHCQSGIVLKGARIAIVQAPTGEAQRVYIAREHDIECLDRTLGRVIWKSPVLNGLVDAGPIVSGRTVVYISNDMSTVKGLDIDSGSVRWSADIQAARMSADGHAVFLTTSTGMGVRALKAENGKQLWKYEPGGPGSISQIFYGDSKVYTDSYILNAANGHVIRAQNLMSETISGNGKVVFVATDTHTIEALNTQTSSAQWNVNFSQDLRPVSLSVGGGTLFFVGYRGLPFTAHSGVLKALRSDNGHLVWELPLSSNIGRLQPAPIASDEDAVYILSPSGDSETRLSAIAATTGRTIWTREFAGKLEGPPVIAGNQLYLTDGPDTLFQIDKAAGDVLKKVELPK